MVTNTFLNLETKDVTLSRSFFTHIGFSINEQYSDESGICVVINDTTYLMVMNKDKFRGFTLSETPNSFNQTEIIISFQLNSKAAVDTLLDKVKAAKGGEFGQATENDFMYYRSFRDLDGHRFEVFFFKPLP
ncbi:VOC family protein [Paracholeplasma manati]|uniref:VOC domain-containing protein n=1 Tax=Paracholeplasma manati TaxID=591373 RepID=A0ABT2Y3X5_9MOLU|nr:hypothetical protein [Paracholeplasma manati]MCV2231429.1 hypothetical protein [Paracholeplasma manati]MDG0889428.1 hypothetical protein [Paracholeplasma manati]